MATSRDSVQMQMIFVQYVKMNFKASSSHLSAYIFVERKNMTIVQNGDFRPYKQMETWSHFNTALSIWSFKLHIKAKNTDFICSDYW